MIVQKRSTLSRFVLSLSVVFLSAAAFAETCRAVKQDGTRCTRRAKGASGYCWQHAKMAAASSRTAVSADDDFPPLDIQFITEQRRVLAVTNGVYLVLDGAQKARLAGVVANNRANAFVRAYCGTNDVTTEYDHLETGRLYATIYLKKGDTCLNEELIRAGLGGVDLRAPFRYRRAFLKAEEEARLARRGLWSDKK